MRGFFIKLIGNKKRKEIDSKNINSVLLIGGRVGDIITKTPLFKALKKLNPNIKIDVVVSKGCEPLLTNHPFINNIFCIENKYSKVKILKVLQTLIFSLKMRKKYDLYLDFSKNVRFSHILGLRFMSPKYIIGCYRMEKFGIKKDELTIFDKYIRTTSADHACDIFIKSLEDFNVDISDRKYELYLGDIEEKYKNYFAKNKINIVFNFLGSSQGRCLCDEDIEYFLEELPKLKENIEVHILTIPSIFEKIKSKLENMNLKNVQLLPKTKDILEAAAIIKYCDFLFSVDTGVIHIASTYNIPILGLYTEDKDTLTIFAPKSDLYKVITGKKENYLKLENREFILQETKNLLAKV